MSAHCESGHESFAYVVVSNHAVVRVLPEQQASLPGSTSAAAALESVDPAYCIRRYRLRGTVLVAAVEQTALKQLQPEHRKHTRRRENEHRHIP
jgi:hypothetical protein